MRTLHRVSTKALILNKEKDKILLIYMPKNNDWGLPGGHVDEGEGLDRAIERELYEECGIKCDNLIRKDFFMHSDGKIILASIGILDNINIKSQQDGLEGIPKWLSREEFNKIQIESVYRDFVLNNWI